MEQNSSLGTFWYWCYEARCTGFWALRHGRRHFVKHYSRRQVTFWTWGIAPCEDWFGSQLLQDPCQRMLRILELWEVGNYESDLVDFDLVPLHAGFR